MGELVTNLESVQSQRVIEAVRDQVSNLVVPRTASPKVREIFLSKVEEVKTLLDQFLAALGTTIGVLRTEKAVKSVKKMENLHSILTGAISKMDGIIGTL